AGAGASRTAMARVLPAITLENCCVMEPSVVQEGATDRRAGSACPTERNTAKSAPAPIERLGTLALAPRSPCTLSAPLYNRNTGSPTGSPPSRSLTPSRSMVERWFVKAFLVVAMGILAAPIPARAAAPEPVSFNRDVRPILADTCFPCHGPDKAKRKVGLRLDTEEGALAARKGRRPVVPGHPEKSEPIRRIAAADQDERMPPTTSGRSLTPQQIVILRRWIAEGARWQPHWSLLPPVRPTLPPARDAAWPHNGLDYFILARLEAEGLKPSPE